MSTVSPLSTGSHSLRRFRILRVAFSFPVAIASLLVVLAVLTVRSRFDDPDMWWHLRMGQFIWTTHTIPLTDLFSFTTNHHATIPHEWLAQVIIFSAYKWAGLSGLMLWLCFFTAALLIAGYALCSLYSGNAKVGFLGALIIWLFATVGYSIRPQMIGYFLLILELLLIHLGRTRNPRWFLWLPLVFAIWINCHGSFFLGLILLAVYLCSSFFDFRMGSLVASHWDPRCRRMLILAMVLSSLALFLNPAGLKQILYPLDAMLNQHVILASVQEYQPLQLSSERGIVFLVVLGCCFLLVAARKAELHLDELILLGLGVWLAGSHDRLLFVFGILAAPILSRMLSTSWEGYKAEEDRIWPNAVLIGMVLLVAFYAFPKSQALTGKVEEGSPVRAVEYIKLHHLSGPMLNEFVYGGYLLWAMPEHPVFLDGRADVFEWTGVLAEFGSWATLQSDPNVLLDKYGIQFCLMMPQSPMAHILPLMHNWKAVYSDRNSVIFVRNSPLNPNL